MVSLFGKQPTLCPVCGSSKTIEVATGRIDTWLQQVKAHPQWMRHRGIDPGAGVPLTPKNSWEVPAFDELPREADRSRAHVRCEKCLSLLPPPFLKPKPKRVFMITTGMPEAGKTTWLQCLFHPERRKHLIAEPTQQIVRQPYRFIEPFTNENLDGRTAIPFLLHGMTLTFQSRSIAIAGVDIKGEVFSDATIQPDKYYRVKDVLDHLREMECEKFFLLFVVPFTGRKPFPDIGRLAASLINLPGVKHLQQGIIWTKLDSATCADEPALRSFVDNHSASKALVQAVLTNQNPLLTDSWFEGLTELTNLVLQHPQWKQSEINLLETLTWLLFKIMSGYWNVPQHHHSTKVEFYFLYGNGLGKTMVEAACRLAAALFAAWDDNVIHGDFGQMVKEGLQHPDGLKGFRVLPCGLDLTNATQATNDPAAEGMPVWGDLLLLEILKS